MGVYDAMKDVAALVQKMDNVELMRKVVDLQTQVYQQADELRALKEELATRRSLVFRDNAYWDRASGEGPFCSKCWDVHSKLVRLHSSSRYKPQCQNCGTIADPPETESAGERAGPMDEFFS